MTDVHEIETESMLCPKCQSGAWERWEYGTYQDVHRIDVSAKNEDWTSHDEDIQTSDEWHCVNGHQATDEIEDLLIDVQGMF